MHALRTLGLLSYWPPKRQAAQRRGYALQIAGEKLCILRAAAETGGDEIMGGASRWLTGDAAQCAVFEDVRRANDVVSKSN